MIKEKDTFAFTTLFPIRNLAESFEWQKPNGCGSAGMKANFNRSRIKLDVSQTKISRCIYDEVWEGSKPVDMLNLYCDSYDDVVCLENLSLETCREELDKGHFIQILWFDNLPESDGDKPEGHWATLNQVSLDEDWVEIVDPSNAERVYNKAGFVRTNLKEGKRYKFERRSSYKIRIDDFLERWYDIVDESGRVAKRLGIVINPYSVKATYIQ